VAQGNVTNQRMTINEFVTN